MGDLGASGSRFRALRSLLELASQEVQVLNRLRDLPHCIGSLGWTKAVNINMRGPIVGNLDSSEQLGQRMIGAGRRRGRKGGGGEFKRSAIRPFEWRHPDPADEQHLRPPALGTAASFDVAQLAAFVVGQSMCRSSRGMQLRAGRRAAKLMFDHRSDSSNGLPDQGIGE
jgi:hypothetical protein